MTLDELREEQDKILHKKKIINKLMKTEAWELLDSIFKERVRTLRNNDFDAVLNGLDSAFRSATLRGIISGTVNTWGLPTLLLQDYDRDLEAIESAIEEAQNETK